jgi:mRNA-degrading endonuclease toxin of MazEF toxin-antitoxin module
MRSLDWRARNVTPMGKMPDAILKEIRAAVRTFAGIPR